MTDHNITHFRGRHYAADHITGPAPFLNPTARLLPLHKAPTATGGAEDGQAGKPHEKPPAAAPSGIYHIWRSRDNRKGRHALALTPSGRASAAVSGGRPLRTTTTLGATLAGISRMLLRFPVWDVSYDVAAIFTLGSAVWVLNGFLVLLPSVRPGDSWAGEAAWGGGVSAAVGASIFEAGSVLLMLEAVNENRSDCFGWALEEALGVGRHHDDDGGGGDGGGDGESEGPLVLLRREKSRCRHHHRDRGAFLTRRGVNGGSGVGLEQTENSNAGAARRWAWWPSWYELRTHYLHDIGFLACLSQMIGATIFWISGFTGLPQVLGVLSVPAENGIYWLPQVSVTTAQVNIPTPTTARTGKTAQEQSGPAMPSLPTEMSPNDRRSKRKAHTLTTQSPHTRSSAARAS